MIGVSMMMNREVIVSTLFAIVCQGEKEFCVSADDDNRCAEVCMAQDPVTLMCEDNLRIQLVNGEHFGPCTRNNPNAYNCDGCPANGTVSECLFMSAVSPTANWPDIMDLCEGLGSCNVPHTPQTVTSSDSRCCTPTTPCSGQSITVVTTITWTCVAEKTSTTLSTNPKPTSTTSGGVMTTLTGKTTDPYESTIVATSDLTTADTTEETTTETTKKTTVTSVPDSTTDSRAESTDSSATSRVTSQAPAPTTEDTDPARGAGNLYAIIGLGVVVVIFALTIIAILLFVNRKRLTSLVPNSKRPLPPPLPTVTYDNNGSGYENPEESVRVHENHRGSMPVLGHQGDNVRVYENQGDTARVYENHGVSVKASGVTENSTYDHIDPQDIDFSSPNYEKIQKNSYSY